MTLETWEGVTSKEAEGKAEAGQNFGRKLIIMGSRDDSLLVWKMRKLISQRLAWMVHDECFSLQMTDAHSQALDLNTFSSS